MKFPKAFRVAVAIIVGGAILRLFAERLAWPDDFSYSPPREDTSWAHQEAAVAQVGISLMALGAAMLLVTLNRWLALHTKEEKQDT